MDEVASRDISWDEIDKFKYYFYGPSLSLLVRFCLYPLSVVKTRLQMQKDPYSIAASAPSVNHYSGTLDAFHKIIRHEGVRGLFKGFGVSTVGIVSGQLYITTYEYVRHHLMHMNERNRFISPKRMNVVRNAVAGGCASLVSQTIVVPIDIVSQKQMMNFGTGDSNGSLVHVSKEILRQDGVKGFYKGFGASLCVYAPSSAIWWGSYGYLRERLQSHFMPTSHASKRLTEASAGASAGLVAAVATNPIDVARTRLQVEGHPRDGSNLRTTLRHLWCQEGPKSLLKGVQARIMASVPSSIMIVTVYELVKRLSKRTDKHYPHRTSL
uniref:Mitochondrial carrier protein n=2 Tax=Guillardia theta TaxID=55529 RepID=A0A7S4NRY9_GUITH|mmetsp:Transcript_31509/g.100820  ORF Transcript_31509/g.100820 Transcript_31509/m.100820 type:complete len:325 (+) Transcript_31509:231-1205(+)